MSHGQVLWANEEQRNRDRKRQEHCEQEQRAKDNSDYAARRSLELARELANWRDWIDLVRTLQR